MPTKNTQNKPKELNINASSFVGSQYSQLVGVTVTGTEITLEFIYINARDGTKGEVVSRITLPSHIGINLAETITKTISEHKEKNK